MLDANTDALYKVLEVADKAFDADMVFTQRVEDLIKELSRDKKMLERAIWDFIADPAQYLLEMLQGQNPYIILEELAISIANKEGF